MVSLGGTRAATSYKGEETCLPAVGTIDISGGTFSCSISLSCSFFNKKKKICSPIQIHFMSPVPAHCGHILHRATLIVSGPVIASEWCALIACKLLQHQFVWLSLEGATGLRALCETGKDWSPREVLSASFPSFSLDLILDESIQRSQEGCPLRKRSVFTPLICKSSDGQKPPASLARSLRWFYQFLQKEI